MDVVQKMKEFSQKEFNGKYLDRVMKYKIKLYIYIKFNCMYQFLTLLTFYKKYSLTYLIHLGKLS